MVMSVIVHNWCRSFLLPLFIKSYVRQDLRGQVSSEEMEMIIIDDNSPPGDKFEEYLKIGLNTFDIKENLWFKIRAFKNRDGTGNSGRSANVGAKLSKGDILIFNHTDIFPMHKNTLRLIYDRHKEYNSDTDIINSGKVEMFYLTTATLTNDNIKFSPDCNGTTPWACAISRKLFYKIGGFDERFSGYGNEDADFGWRVIYGAKDLGCQHIFDPRIVYVHLQQSNMISLPPSINLGNHDVVNDNITYNHRWIVNSDKGDNWGISKDIEEIDLGL